MKRWTPDRKASFTAAWLRGDTCADIGVREGISPAAVSQQAKRMGLPTRGSPMGIGRKPKPFDRERAIELLESGLSIRAVATEMRIDREIIARLGVCKTPMWTEEKRKEVMRMHAEDFSFAAIGAKFGVSKNAIAGLVQRLGLPTRGSPIKRQDQDKPLHTDERDELLRRYVGLPIEWVTAQINLLPGQYMSATKAARRRAELGVELTATGAPVPVLKPKVVAPVPMVRPAYTPHFDRHLPMDRRQSQGRPVLRLRRGLSLQTSI